MRENGALAAEKAHALGGKVVLYHSTSSNAT